MKLELEHFCCWEKKRFEFPDTGTVLISAPSGFGKTSIVRAIMFALFGKEQKVVMFGKKSCKVILEYGNLHIVRTKGPKRLIVNDVFEDAEGQHLILHALKHDQMFYLGQNNRNSFVCMNASDKLVYLEHMMEQTNDKSIQELHASNKQRRKQFEEQHKEYTIQHTMYEQWINEHRSYNITLDTRNRERIAQTPVHEVIDVLKQSLCTMDEQYRYVQELKHDLTTTQQRLDDHRSRMEQINDILATLGFNSDSDIRTSIDHIQSIKQLLTTYIEYNACKKDLKERKQLFNSIRQQKTTLTQDIHDIEHTLQQLNYSPDEWSQKLTDIQTTRQYEHTRQSLHRRLTDIPAVDDITIDHLTTEKQRIEETLHRCKTEERIFNKPMTCPSCHASLQLEHNHTLCMYDVHSNTDQHDTHALTCTLNEISDTLATHEHHRSIRHHLQKELDALPPSVWIDNDEETQLLECRDQYMQFNALLVEKKQTLATINHEFIHVRDDILRRREKCSQLKEIIGERPCPSEYSMDDIHRKSEELHKTFIKWNTLHDELATHQATFQSLSHTYRKTTNAIASIQATYGTDLSHQIKQIEHDIDLLQQYQRMEHEIERFREYERLYQETSSRLDERAHQIVACQHIAKHIDEAHARSLSLLIDTINTNAQVYLDAFFPDTPLQVSIQSQKTTHTQTRTHIHLDCFYRGHPNIDIHTLSGGEFDRLVLAFNMVFAEYNASPFIMLDECVSSLDQDTANQLFAFIHEHLSDRLVIVIAHQMVVGMFDHVLDLYNEK